MGTTVCQGPGHRSTATSAVKCQRNRDRSQNVQLMCCTETIALFHTTCTNCMLPDALDAKSTTCAAYNKYPVCMSIVQHMLSVLL